MTSRPTCSPPSARGSPGSWSKPASTCPPPTTTPAEPPTTSLTPSPACPPSSSTCGDRHRRQQAADQPHHADLAEERVALAHTHALPGIFHRGPDGHDD